MDNCGTEVDTDDENPPDDEMATLPLRRALRHRCSLRNCAGAHMSSYMTRQSTPANMYWRYANSNHNADVEDRPAHEDEMAALVSAVEDRIDTQAPIHHRQLEFLTTEKKAVSSRRLSEAASAPLTASEAVRTPPIMGPATQDPCSSAAKVYSATPSSPTPSVYITSPTYSLSYTSSLMPSLVCTANLATHSPSAYLSTQTPTSAVNDRVVIQSPAAYSASQVSSSTAYSASQISSPTAYSASQVSSPTAYSASQVSSPTAYSASQVSSPTAYSASQIPSPTAYSASQIPSPTAYCASLPPCSVPQATREPASDFHTGDTTLLVPPYNTTWIPSTPVPFTTPSSRSTPSIAPSSRSAPSTTPYPLAAPSASTPQLIPRSPNASNQLCCASLADQHHHTCPGSAHRTLHVARPLHRSSLPWSSCGLASSGGLALSHVAYSTRRTYAENSKYEYITSYEFLRRVHDLALVMASQRLSLRYLQNLSCPARCLIQGRIWKWFRCIKSPWSREITPVFRQYCKKFIMAMLCPQQAPSEVITVATMVDTVEKKAYADDPNFKMYYCWQLATVLCLILEELGSIGLAR